MTLLASVAGGLHPQEAPPPTVQQRRADRVRRAQEHAVLIRFVEARTRETAATVHADRCVDPAMLDAVDMAATALSMVRSGQVTPGTVRALALVACLYDQHRDFQPVWSRWSR